MWEEEFIKKYNHCIKRYEKACSFFSNPNTPIEAMEEWQVEFIKIVNQLGLMMLEYKEKTGQEMSKEESENGFKV